MWGTEAGRVTKKWRMFLKGGEGQKNENSVAQICMVQNTDQIHGTTMWGTKKWSNLWHNYVRSRGEKDHSGKDGVPSETYQAEPGNGHLMVHKKNIVVNNSQAFSMNISI